MLNITNEQGDFEVVERQFMLQNRSSFGKSEFGCPPTGPCGPSGGGGGGEPGPGPGQSPTPTPPGEGGTEQWNMTYGGPGSDAAYSVRSIGSGYVLAGSTGGDALIVFTDNSGVQLSNRTFGGPGFDKANQVIQADGSFVLAGLTSGVSQDAWLIKTDNVGNELWNMTYGGPNSEEAKAVIRNMGGFVFTGSTDSYGNGSTDAWLVKTDYSGIMQWNKAFGGEYNGFSQGSFTNPGWRLYDRR